MERLTLTINSRSLAMDTETVVLLPEGHAPETGWKTLWLLHGASDDETIWSRRSSVERYVNDCGLAVVMPDALLSCYSDMAHGGYYYTWITRELPMTLRQMLRLSSRREDNFVAGLSMGGEGSLKIGLSQPENYAAVGCLSAGMFNHPWIDEPDEAKNYRNFLLFDGKKLEGSPEDGFENAKKILADGKPVPQIYHAIGTEDFLLKAARETRDFFSSLPGNPFGYVYEEYPGAHTWEFWDTHIQDFLRYLENRGFLKN